MKSGATSLELDVTHEFTNDGDASLVSICVDGRKLPRQLAERLLMVLSRKDQQRIVDECWENAEEEADDSACDEARAPGAA